MKPGWRISESAAATAPAEPRLPAPAVLPAAPPKTLPHGASPSGLTTVAFSHFASSNSAVCHFASGFALVTRQAALDSLRTTLPDSRRTTSAAIPPSLRASTAMVLRPGFSNLVTSVWAASAHSSDLPAGWPLTQTSMWLSAAASNRALVGTSLRSMTVRAQVCWLVTLFLAVQIH